MQGNLTHAFPTTIDQIGQFYRQAPEEESLTNHSGTDAARLALVSAQAQVNAIVRAAGTVSETLAKLATASVSPTDLVAELAVKTIPRWHFAMLNDHERNDAFAVALERRIRPGSHVLDIGTGTGLLAMMAVQAGAAKVTACEANPLLAEIAHQVIDAHGMGKAVTVIPKRSTELVVGRDMDTPADLVMTEIADCGLVGEGLLPTMRHARQHLLAEGGQLLPQSARLFGFLVDSPVVAGLNRVSGAGGFDVGLLNLVATQGHFPVRLSTWPHQVVSETVELIAFDLSADSLQDGHRMVTLPVTRDGVAHGLIAWFEMDLGANVLLRNSPENLGSHWMQALVSFDQPVPVTAGKILEIELRWTGERLTAHVDSSHNFAKGTR